MSFYGGDKNTNKPSFYRTDYMTLTDHNASRTAANLSGSIESGYQQNGDLFLTDLINLQRTGRFDERALLRQQDNYMQRAITARPVEAAAAAQNGQEAFDAFVRSATIQIHMDSKVQMRLNLLQDYCDAAAEIFNEMAERYGKDLAEVAEKIREAIKAGRPVDLYNISANLYLSAAGASNVVESLQHVNATAAVQQRKQHERAMQNLFADTTLCMERGEGVSVSRELARVLSNVFKEPERYINWVSPDRLPSRPSGPWDFEATHRQVGAYDGGISFGR
jgi:hypothetical protein